MSTGERPLRVSRCGHGQTVHTPVGDMNCAAYSISWLMAMDVSNESRDVGGAKIGGTRFRHGWGEGVAKLDWSRSSEEEWMRQQWT